MKKDIHPTYHKEATVECACGNTFTVGSTQEKIETEICSECHPFYTGKGKLVDSAGRIEKFKERMQKHEELKEKAAAAKAKTKKKETEKDTDNEDAAVPEAPDLPAQTEDSNIRVTKE